MFRQTICYISVLLMLGLGLWVSSAWQDVLPMVAAHPDRFFCMARCSTYVFSTFSAMVVHPDSFFFSLARCFTILKMTTWFKYWLLWQHWYNSTANMRQKNVFWATAGSSKPWYLSLIRIWISWHFILMQKMSCENHHDAIRWYVSLLLSEALLY